MILVLVHFPFGEFRPHQSPVSLTKLWQGKFTKYKKNTTKIVVFKSIGN